jgi:hypothetical protein
MRRFVSVLALAMLAAACARTATPLAGGGRTGSPAASAASSGSAVTASPFTTSPSPRSSPSPRPTLHGSRSLGESDSGSTVVLHVGDAVSVTLGSEYDQPEARSDILDRTSASGGYPSGRPAQATFRAVSTGKTDVESSTDYSCLHSTPPCRIAQRLWIVHVVVE